MVSDNVDTLHGHVLEVEANHWTVTVNQEILLPWNSKMAQINSNLVGFPLSRIWYIWISAAEGE